jgi:hypothetical protein
VEYWSVGVMDRGNIGIMEWWNVGLRKRGCLNDPLFHSSNIPWFQGWNPIEFNERMDINP